MTTKTTANDDAAADTQDDAAPMTAWDMSVSIMAGLHKAKDKAEQEFREASTSNPGGGPFAHGKGRTMHLRNALQDAIETLDPDIRQIARSNGLPMPKISKR